MRCPESLPPLQKFSRSAANFSSQRSNFYADATNFCAEKAMKKGEPQRPPYIQHKDTTFRAEMQIPLTFR